MCALEFYTNCVISSAEEINNILEVSRGASYNNLKNKIKKYCPSIYIDLALDLYNPYEDRTAQTKDYYILVHSAIEYIFRKVQLDK